MNRRKLGRVFGWKEPATYWSRPDSKAEKCLRCSCLSSCQFFPQRPVPPQWKQVSAPIFEFPHRETSLSGNGSSCAPFSFHCIWPAASCPASSAFSQGGVLTLLLCSSHRFATLDANRRRNRNRSHCSATKCKGRVDLEAVSCGILRFPTMIEG